MRSPANKISRLCSTCILIFGVLTCALGQSNQCHCAEPPGGTVTCEPGQIPICIVRDGRITGMCKTPPKNASKAELQAWLLSEVLGMEVTEADIREKQEYRTMLSNGQIRTAALSANFLSLDKFRDAEHLVPASKVNQSTAANVGGGDKGLSRGLSLLSEGKYAEAEAEFRGEIKANPTSVQAYEYLAYSLFYQGKYVEAEAIAKKLIELEPRKSEFYMFYGNILFKQQKYNEAIEALGKAIELEPKNAEWQNARGVILHMQQKYANAEGAFRKAIELQPTISDWYANLGAALYVQGKLTEAEQAYRKAIELSPDSARFHAGLGSVLFAQEKYSQAVDSFKEALRLDPTNTGFQMILREAQADLTKKP
jgi:Flp pilus assembly protein TadD